jgi:3-hydroxyisobutyrate dehydrogenase
MGRAIASRALATGHAVTVWNRSPAAAAELVGSGARHAESIGDAVASAEVALLVVADDDAAEAVCLGGGAMAALSSAAVLANISTVSPQTARRLAAAGQAGQVLDAPVNGAPALVADGGGHFLIGGDEHTVTSLESLWRDLGSGYTYCGPAGTGVTMKLISNLQLIVGVTALAEGISIGRSLGISDDLLRTVFAHSPVISMATQARLDSLLSTAHPGWFGPALARKDIRLALALATQTGVPVEVGPATERLLSGVTDHDPAWPDFTAVIEALR